MDVNSRRGGEPKIFANLANRRSVSLLLNAPFDALHNGFLAFREFLTHYNQPF